MKKLSMICLLGLASVSAFAQSMYLKKITAEVDPFNSVLIHYTYDENMHLQAIHTVNPYGDTVVTKEYEDERLVLQYGPGFTYYLEYAADSVYEYRLQSDETYALAFVYIVNGLHQVTKSIVVDPSNGNYGASQEYTWSAGNCTTTKQGGTTVGTCTYDTDVLNPMYNENKFFRRGSGGALNQYVDEDYYGTQYTMTIISTLNGYPEEMLYTFGGNEQTLHYEYIETSGVTPAEMTGGYTVLDRKYYTLSGQEIEKPTEGICLEVLYTNKGVISRKRFIRPR